ncbi:MAG TPA: hypothetical protein VJ946_03930 [Bacteroidales bacterium]|nr:hypothetical protein [Bacteroidales bacterium]
MKEAKIIINIKDNATGNNTGNRSHLYIKLSMSMFANRLLDFFPVFYKHVKSNNMKLQGKGRKKTSDQQNNYHFEG